MKIVDFFGVGVPVISLSFPAIGELVRNGVNGLLIENKDGVKESDELCRLLTEVLSNEGELERIRKGALEESKKRWDANWTRKLGPKFPENS